MTTHTTSPHHPPAGRPPDSQALRPGRRAICVARGAQATRPPGAHSPEPGAARPRHAPRRRDAGGTSTLYAVILMVAVFLIVGLVVDGGAMLTAHQEADSVARQAARTAGQAVVLDSAGRVAVTRDGANAGLAYAHDHGCENSAISIAGTTITATCSIRYNPLFLPGTYLATRTATADAKTVHEP